jgi:hypothetical protein
MVIMNRLSTAKRVAVVSALVEGCSIRSTVRMTGVSKNTIAKLLLELGAACTRYQDETLRNLPCKRIQCDEIWSFVGGKDKNISQEKKASGLGSIWTWTAIDADTEADRLVARRLTRCRVDVRVHAGRGGPPSWPRAAHDRRSQTYLNAVEAAFGAEIDYAVLQKIYGNESNPEKRYSPAVCLGCKVENVTGEPEPKAHFNVLRRAPEPHDADVDASVHAPDECVQQESREPSRGGRRPILHVLQLWARASDAPRDARDGSWRRQSRVGYRRNRRSSQLRKGEHHEQCEARRMDSYRDGPWRFGDQLDCSDDDCSDPPDTIEGNAGERQLSTGGFH